MISKSDDKILILTEDQINALIEQVLNLPIKGRVFIHY